MITPVGETSPATVHGALANLVAAGYRIVQEGLTNVLRHAGPVEIELRIAVAPDQVAISIRNSLDPVTVDRRHPIRVLVLSVETVKTHVRGLLAKMRVRDRTQAVIAAYESGIVQPNTAPPGPSEPR